MFEWEAREGTAYERQDMKDSPITLSAAILLRLARVLARVTSFGEVSREMLFGFSSAVSQSGVGAISELVGASH